jgi:hypothetical protein
MSQGNLFATAVLKLCHPSSFPENQNEKFSISAHLCDFPVLWSYFLHSLCRPWPLPQKPMQSLLKGMLHQVNPLSCLILLFSMHRFSCFLDPHPFNTILDVCKSKWDEIDYNSFKVFRYRFEVDCVSYNVIVNGWLCNEKNNPSSCTASDGVWLW